MQSQVKRSGGGSIFKLSDVMKNELDSSAPAETENQRLQPLPGNKDRGELSDAKITGHFPDPEELTARPAPSGGEEGALAWLKSIGNSNPGFTGDSPARSDTPVVSVFHAPHPARPSLRWPPHNAAASGIPNEESAFDEPGGASKLTRRLSLRFDPRNAPPQSLRAALMPYVAATAVFAFLAGSAMVYFLTESPAPVRTMETVSPAEPNASFSAAPPDQPSAKKGIPQQAAPQLPPAPANAPSRDNMGFLNLSGEPSVSQPTAPQKLETWSDTLEAFKQFVKKPGDGRR